MVWEVLGAAAEEISVLMVTIQVDAPNKAAAAPAPQKEDWTREADESEEELPF